MNGELSLGGVFVPSLLVLAVAAMALSFVLIRLLTVFGFYRFVAYRALVDLSFFVLTLGLLAWIVPLLGYRL
jgi:hypothetical protein